MNVGQYLGLDNAYSYVLSQFSLNSRFNGPYVVDEQLRETPIIPDYSFRAFQSTDDHVICDYFNPLVNGERMFMTLSKHEYEKYMFVRQNAFYTPYGVMVLLRQPMISCTNSFTLVDDSLIPVNRPIECVDSKMAISNNSSIGATFFADFVMEDIILGPSNGILHESMYLYDTRAICPVLMKRVKLNPNIPVYDVQFNDLMAFDTMISYDMYMLAVSNYMNGTPSRADKLNFRFNPTDRLFKCYPRESINIKENLQPQKKNLKLKMR